MDRITVGMKECDWNYYHNGYLSLLASNLTFDDVALVPRVFSNIESRKDIDLEQELCGWITSDSLKIPIIAAPMKDVCDKNVALIMDKIGGLGIIHRFMSIEKQVQAFRDNNWCGCAIGVNNDWHKRFKALYDVGCRLFCIDVANGANIKVKKVIEKLATIKLDLIVGNVASKECFDALKDLPNVKAIRVGIAGGMACTTKNATGIGYGMISSIQECAADKGNTILIADGGIREPSDMCKAIAAGANCVMMGSNIANTVDSPAEILERDGILYKVYHGSASFDVQILYRDNPKYIEGTTKLLKYSNENLVELIDRFTDGLKSSMSYFNAKNITEFHNNSSFATRR